MPESMRIAVVSPFLDKRHGTELVTVEQIEHLARKAGWDVHIYSQRVEDLPGLELAGSRPSSAADGHARSDSAGRLVWHRVPGLPGPHLLQYVWWYIANSLSRWWDTRFRGISYDLVYSPGINCPDADVIAVHVVFHEFHRHVAEELRLSKVPLRAWPRTLHRRLYYRLARALEMRTYPQPDVRLAAVSGLTARELQHHFGRHDVTVIPNAVDLHRFNPQARKARRAEARCQFHFTANDLVLLLIGNGWRNKGLDYLLGSAALCSSESIKVLVVGRDDRTPYLRQVERLGLRERVCFAEPSPDVMRFYAAADVYVGPSLHDSFALPPAEAMACGLPVVTSRCNGGSEMISHGEDGFVLDDPADVKRIAQLIEQLQADAEYRCRIGDNAARVAAKYTWERNAELTKEFLLESLKRKPVGGTGCRRV